MTYTQALKIFDKMNLETKERVIRDFDLIRMESGAPRIFSAFIQAVAMESEALQEALQQEVLNLKC